MLLSCTTAAAKATAEAVVVEGKEKESFTASSTGKRYSTGSSTGSSSIQAPTGSKGRTLHRLHRTPTTATVVFAAPGNADDGDGDGAGTGVAAAAATASSTASSAASFSGTQRRECFKSRGA